MKIEAYLTPMFPEREAQFKNNIVVIIDVFRASSTICAALSAGARQVIPSETTEKAVKIYSSLDRDIRFLGGERNAKKPSGFDAGNSPSEYTDEAVSGKSVILTTTNGTQLCSKAKEADKRIVAGFVNQSVVYDSLKSKLQETPDLNITFLCAGSNGHLAYEDTICAGGFIDKLKNDFPDTEITDSAHVAMSLFRLHKDDFMEFLGRSEHALRLKESGFQDDLELCLTQDKYPVVPVIDGTTIKSENIN